MSFYVLAVDNRIKKYPYTLTDLRRDNPNIDFPHDIPDDLAAQYYTYPVIDTPKPAFNPDTQYIVWVSPTFANNVWTQVWGIANYTPEEQAERVLAWRQTASCTPFQGRMALADAGLLPGVETAVASADEKTRVAWEYALLWQRTSPMIAALAGALQLTDTQIDDLFKAAAQISA